MKMMPCREVALEKTLEGLSKCNTPLISVHSGQLAPAGFADDLGIYYFIPLLAKTFGIDSQLATTIFFTALISIGMITCFISLTLLFKNKLSRITIWLGLVLLTLVAYGYSDVYVASIFAVSTIAPVAIVFTHRRSENLWIFFMISGLIIGFSNTIRLHAGTGMLIFLFAWLFFNSHIARRKAIAYAAILLLFTSIPHMYFYQLETRRDLFLSKMDPSYAPQSVIHPKWHSIYIGLGYLENNYGIQYNDSVAANKALSVDPDVKYCSTKYEKILKNECFLLAKKDPMFVLRTVLSKCQKILLAFCLFSNLGLAFAIFGLRPSYKIAIPLLIAALFYALPGIVTMPLGAYISGMVSISTIFGIYTICLNAEKHQTSKNLSW